VDEELRVYLTAMEDRLKSHVDERVENSVRATAAEIGALHTSMQQLEARFTAKMDDFQNRIDRHAGMLQTGARQLTRAFRDDERLSRQWRALAKRVDALEPRRKNGNGQPPADS
jgi:hypothetical protein